MANYTITRHTESDYAYGCTNFSTNQVAGQIASDIAGAALDATVVWDLKANAGYSVAIEDFIFSNGTIINTAAGFSYWKDLPSPILGAVMEKISSILIRITLYLMPPQIGNLVFNSGSSFVMPSLDVDITVVIEGCAKVAGEGVHLRINNPLDRNTITNVIVDESLEKNIVSNYLSDKRDEIHGILPSLPTKAIGDGTSRLIFSYIALAEDGYRYNTPPSLIFSDKNYHAKTTLTETINAHSTNKAKDITGVRFDVYKKN
jgi:hypothetical protein